MGRGRFDYKAVAQTILVAAAASALLGCSAGTPAGWARMKVKLGDQRPLLPVAPQIRSNFCEIPFLDIVITAADLDYPLRYSIAATMDQSLLASASTTDPLMETATYEILVPEGESRVFSLEGVVYDDVTCSDSAADAYPIYGVTAATDVTEGGTVSIPAKLANAPFTLNSSQGPVDPAAASGSQMVSLTIGVTSSACDGGPGVINLMTATDLDTGATMVTSGGGASGTFYAGQFIPNHVYSIDFECNGSGYVGTCDFVYIDRANSGGMQNLNLNPDCGF